MADAPEKPADSNRLKRLFGDLCNDTLRDEDREELVQRLHADAAARRYYLDYMLVHVKLMEHAELDGYSRAPQPLGEDVQAVLEEAGIREALADCGCDLVELNATNTRVDAADPKRSRRLIAAAAAIAATLAVVVGLQALRGDGAGTGLASAEQAAGGLLGVEQPELVSTGSENRSTANGHLYVAQIGGLTSDVRWRDPSVSREFLLRVRRGDRLELESGLVELDYFSGTSIILKGPCEFVATGAASGRLVSGELTGNASDGDFSLTTPTAKVIDLGTAFGVALDDKGNTDVCVLEGEVRVTNALASVSKADSRLLKEGMAVRVARGSGITSIANPGSKRFTRALPSPESSDELVSLVGVLSGVRGDRFRVAGVIAADSGESDRDPWLRVDGPGHSGSNGYQTTDWHPYVDGVFIPSPDGGATRLDSAGNAADLPPSMGRTWGPVWSRMRLDAAPAESTQDDYWGTDTLEGVVDQLAECETGMIGLHSNVGVTFDLRAIADRWGKTPVLFSAALCNLDNSLVQAPLEWALENRFSASFRLYVDGELRESKLDFTRNDGRLVVSADLREGDRFLTLVSSDAGRHQDESAKHGYDAFDHVVLIDPVLLFGEEGQAEAE